MPGSKLGALLAVALSVTQIRGDLLQLYDPLDPPEYGVVRVKAGSFVANDPVSIYNLFHGWKGAYHPKSGSNAALGSVRLEMGGRSGAWYLAYAHRYDFVLKGSRDFVDLFHTIKQKASLAPGRRYRLDVAIRGLEADSLTLSRSWRYDIAAGNSLRWGAAISLLRANEWQRGSLTGEGVATETKAYGFDVTASYRYTHNYLYTLAVDPGNGYGFSTDLAIAWQNRDIDIGIEILVNDLLGRLRWFDLPYSRVNARSENKHYDQRGEISYSPTVSGLETSQDTTLGLHPRYRFSFSKGFADRYRLEGGVEESWGVRMPYLSLGYRYDATLAMSLSYESRFGSLGYRCDWGDFAFSFRTDALHAPSVVGATLLWYYHF